MKTVLSSDRLVKAEQLFASGHYRAAILEAFIVLDVGLRQLATKNHLSQKDNVRPTMMRDVIASLAQSKILTSEQRNALGNVQQIRNKAVHIPDEPPELDAKLVIDAAKQFLPLFDLE